MRREHSKAAEETFPIPIFYAPLTANLLPTIANNNDFTTKANTNFAFNSTEKSAYNTSATSKLIWNVPTLAETDYTFCIWLKRISQSGCSYSFGAPHPTPSSARYYGLMYEEHSSSKSWKLGTEYCNNFYVSTHTTALSSTSAYNFFTTQIKYNGSNSYTCAIYVDGVLINESTFTNTTWKGLNGCYIGISNGTSNNALRAYYRHFSVYDRYLSAEQILSLYNNGGIPF